MPPQICAILKRLRIAAARPWHHIGKEGAGPIGANAMRFVLALGLLMALCASANAAARVHHVKPRHVILRNSMAAMPRFVAPPVRYDDTPSYNDPSKWGGGAP
jgi:hypothetical protein